jgi:hypothetical protein
MVTLKPLCSWIIRGQEDRCVGPIVYNQRVRTGHTLVGLIPQHERTVWRNWHALANSFRRRQIIYRHSAGHFNTSQYEYSFSQQNHLSVCPLEHGGNFYDHGCPIIIRFRQLLLLVGLGCKWKPDRNRQYNILDITTRCNIAFWTVTR